MEDDQYTSAPKRVPSLASNPPPKSVTALNTHEEKCEAILDSLLDKVHKKILAKQKVDYNRQEAKASLETMCDPFRSTSVANVPKNPDLYWFTDQVKTTQLNPTRFKVGSLGAKTAENLVDFIMPVLEMFMEAGYGSLMAMLLYRLEKSLAANDFDIIGGEHVTAFKAVVLPRCIVAAVSNRRVQPIVVHVIMASALEVCSDTEFQSKFLCYGTFGTMDPNGHPPLSRAIRSRCSRKVLQLLLTGIGSVTLQSVGSPEYFIKAGGNTPFHCMAEKHNYPAALLLRVFMVRDPTDKESCANYDAGFDESNKAGQKPKDMDDQMLMITKASDDPHRRKTLLDKE